MRRRPDSTAHLATKTVRGGRGLSYPTAPAGAIVTSVAPPTIGFSHPRLPQRALTAAARILSGEGLEGTRVRIPTESWQSDVWALRHEVGELRFVGDRQASAVSGCRLYIGAKPEPGAEPAPVTDGPLADLSEAMFGDAAANQQALNRAAKHLVYNGETEIVVTDTGDRRTWYPWAPQEITGSADMGWKVNDGMDTRPLEDTELLIRCWSPAPERQQYADAPTQSILPVARELVGLTKYVSAQIDSRLAGAGLLLVPQGIVPMAGQGYDADTSFAQALMSAMVTAVRDRESAASLVPVIAEIDPTLVDKVQHLKFDSVLDPKAHELRDEAIRRIGLGMDSDPAVLLGMSGANHWCTDETTEILTRDRGWITHDHLEEGDVVLTLNHDTGMSEWQPVQAIYRAHVVDEPMVEVSHPRAKSLTTMAHRWPVTIRGGERKWTTTAEMLADARSSGDRVQRYEHLVLSAPHADIPQEAKYTDALVEIVAWYFTEGTKGIRPGRLTPKVTIYQSHEVNPENCASIERALTALFGPKSDRLDKGGRYSTPESVARRTRAREMSAAGMSTRAIANELGVSTPMVSKYLVQDAKVRDSTPKWRTRTKATRGMTEYVLNSAAAEVILEHAPNRVVRRDFILDLTLAQLHLFIDTAIKADGHMNGPAHELSQKDPAMLEAFDLAGILTGRSVRRYSSTSTKRCASGPCVKTLAVSSLGSSTKLAPRNQSVHERTYTGVVWCPTTPNHSWFARRDGATYFTGNSGWQIDENEVRLAVAPIAATICHALTSGWLRPYLTAAGIPDAHKYQVWFDATPLEIRPDRSKDAQALFDKGAVKDATLRRENGFGDDDAPDPEEKKRALLERLVVGAPTLAPALLPLLGIEVPQQALEQAADIVSATGGEDPNAPSGGGSGSSPDGSGDSPGGVVAGPPATLDDGPPQ